MLEIDGLRLVQSQAIIRYLARRANLNGLSTVEEVSCDMYAESICDMLSMLLKAPWTRMIKTIDNTDTSTTTTTTTAMTSNTVDGSKHENDTDSKSADNEVVTNNKQAQEHILATRDKWNTMLGPKLEQRLIENFQRIQKELLSHGNNNNNNNDYDNNNIDDSNNHNSSSSSSSTAATKGGQGQKSSIEIFPLPCLFGQEMTYIDILVAHLVTWLIEEIGCSCVERYPNILRLQQRIVKLPGMIRFLGSSLYYHVGDDDYCKQVDRTLGR